MKLIQLIPVVALVAHQATAFAPSPLTRHAGTLTARLSPTKSQPLLFATKVENEEKIKANTQKTKYCIPLEQIGLDDLPKVGGKTASLGEMIQELSPLGVDVPGGFGVSSTAYDGRAGPIPTPGTSRARLEGCGW